AHARAPVIDDQLDTAGGETAQRRDVHGEEVARGTGRGGTDKPVVRVIRRRKARVPGGGAVAGNRADAARRTRETVRDRPVDGELLCHQVEVDQRAGETAGA